MKKDTRDRLLLPIVIPFGALALIGLALYGFSRVLLSVSHDAATVTALVVVVTIMATAGIISRQKRVMTGALGSMLGVVAGVAMVAGSLAFLIVGPQKEELKPVIEQLVAPSDAATNGFATDTLSFPANTKVSLQFDNQEPSIPHDVQIFKTDPAKDATEKPLFHGEVITGPAKITYAVQPLPAGTYFFDCVVHPTTMHGTLTVGGSGASGAPPTGSSAPPASSPPTSTPSAIFSSASIAPVGGPTTTSISASGLAFDLSAMNFPAGKASKLTFDNQDPGVDHNVAIYSDANKSQTLFDGDHVLGPASVDYTIPALAPGTYYFQCDVHPGMNGSVTVS
jgi:plastocyanin